MECTYLLEKDELELGVLARRGDGPDGQCLQHALVNKPGNLQHNTMQHALQLATYTMQHGARNRAAQHTPRNVRRWPTSRPDVADATGSTDCPQGRAGRHDMAWPYHRAARPLLLHARSELRLQLLPAPPLGGWACAARCALGVALTRTLGPHNTMK